MRSIASGSVSPGCDFDPGDGPEGDSHATLSRYRRPGGHMEPDFFLIHFYQTTIYVALLILLFYMEDRWAYRIGMLTPSAWRVMALATGMLRAAIRQMFLSARELA